MWRPISRINRAPVMGSIDHPSCTIDRKGEPDAVCVTVAVVTQIAATQAGQQPSRSIDRFEPQGRLRSLGAVLGMCVWDPPLLASCHHKKRRSDQPPNRGHHKQIAICIDRYTKICVSFGGACGAIDPPQLPISIADSSFKRKGFPWFVHILSGSSPLKMLYAACCPSAV
jgi:hypothetical protein